MLDGTDPVLQIRHLPLRLHRHARHPVRIAAEAEDIRRVRQLSVSRENQILRHRCRDRLLKPDALQSSDQCGRRLVLFLRRQKEPHPVMAVQFPEKRLGRQRSGDLDRRLDSVIGKIPDQIQQPLLAASHALRVAERVCLQKHQIEPELLHQLDILTKQVVSRRVPLRMICRTVQKLLKLHLFSSHWRYNEFFETDSFSRRRAGAVLSIPYRTVVV